jgi:hypothetical protein
MRYSRETTWNSVARRRPQLDGDGDEMRATDVVGDHNARVIAAQPAAPEIPLSGHLSKSSSLGNRWWVSIQKIDCNDLSESRKKLDRSPLSTREEAARLRS